MVYRLIESKVCSRSHGHPPGARNRAIIATALSNFSPVDTELMYHSQGILSLEWSSVLRRARFTLQPSILWRKSVNAQDTFPTLLRLSCGGRRSYRNCTAIASDRSANGVRYSGGQRKSRIAQQQQWNCRASGRYVRP